MTHVPMSELHSATPDSPVRASERVDPYWASLWSQGSQAAWVSQDVAERQAAEGLATIPSYLNPPLDRAWLRLGGNGRGQELRFAMLAAIDAWRTVTGEQAAAISGELALADASSGTAGDLFATGIMDVGLFTNALVHTRGAHRGTLYRPARTKVFERRVLPRLTLAEWIGITGGQPWSSGSQFDRHNVLSVELALRAAEWCEVGAVFGEKLSTWDLLAFSGLGRRAPVGAVRAADATIVRTDGVRIAVEITASNNDAFKDKARRWAQLISNTRMADSGLVVVFVVASRPDKQVRARETMVNVRKIVAAAARDFPGVNHDRTAERMFVASWEDWFPKPGIADTSFLTLAAERPTGAADDRWERASILDPFDIEFIPSNPEMAEAVLTNAHYVRSVPHWLRKPHEARALWPVPLKLQGLTGVPVPPPARPELSRGKALGAGGGASAPAKPPKRLAVR